MAKSYQVVNEFDFIRRLREQTRSRPQSSRLSVGIGDDAAVIRQYSDRDLVLTTDLLVEGVDFHPQTTPPCLLGHKALAVSMSDVAAMGARPRWALASVGFAKDVWESNFRDDFFAGYLGLADRYGVTLAGGDVSAAQQIVIDSILVGEVKTGRAVLRSTAQPGDQIFVTGSLGGAAAGLKLIELGARLSEPPAARGPREGLPSGVQDAGEANSQLAADGRPQDGGASVPGADRGPHAGSPRGVVDATGSTQYSEEDAIDSLLLRQLSPQPRVGWGIVLGEEHLATSMIDISDGLSSDLHHLCAQSNVGATIDAASLPLNEHAVQLCGRRALDPLALALHGGEDFELLFTVAPKNVARLPKFVDGIPISHIGEIGEAAGGVGVSEQNRVWELAAQGFEHFGSNKPGLSRS
ncbi:MAG TPA: thiamine-phosphate kinase [Pyrinomonadaceae bacterium]